MTSLNKKITTWYGRLEPMSEHLAEAVRQALPALTDGEGSIAGVALFSDSDASTLVPAGLTVHGLAELCEDDPELAQDYPWMVDEWDLQLDDGDPFAPVMDRVNEIADGLDLDEDEDAMAWADCVWTWQVEVMRRLRPWFDATYPGANVVFHVTDEEIPAETLVEWVELLNPPERARTFVPE